MLGIDFGLSDDVLTGLALYGVVIFAAFWLAMIFWTYRDMRARSRDSLAQIGVTVMVAVLTLPGLFIYLLLRPRETLSEAYERSLEEEALLQEIEEKPTCPGCGQRVDADWQVCPHCHTRQKKTCISCRKLMELSWELCPYCATPQVPLQDESLSFEYTPPPARVSVQRKNPAERAAGSVEFVDSDDY